MCSSKIHTLLVEDDPDQASFIRFILESQIDSMSVSIANSLNEAYSYLATTVPQLVIIDLLLPDGSGLTLLPATTQEIPYPIIVTTAYGNEQIAVEALKRGALDYVVKSKASLDSLPHVAQRVLREWRHITGRKRAEAALEKAYKEIEQRVKARTQELFETNRRLQREIRERKRIEKALYEEKERAQVTLYSIGDGVITTDAKTRVDYLNPVAEQLTGWRLEAARGHPIASVFKVIDEYNRTATPNTVAQCLKQGRVVSLADHSILVSHDNQEFGILGTVAPMRDRNGNLTGIVLVFQDVSEARRMAQQIAHQATHDALTGLINRREFEDRLKRVVNTARIEKSEHALCYLDLDQFKVINDTCGHIAGDELLRQLGSLLQTKVRARDTLARLGGDEFGVLMEHCHLEQAQRVAETLRKLITDFRFFWEDRSFSIGVSIGLVAIHEASEGITGTLRAADNACYTAKEKGRNRIQVYREDDVELAKLHGEMQWVVRIPQALEEDRFQLSFQSIIALDGTKDTKGHYELLIRLKGEDGHIVRPGAFLPAAERYNLVEKIDRWVIARALNWLTLHPQHLEELFLCAINLSGQSLGNSEFLEFIEQCFQETGVPPEKICFEITETAAITNLSAATQFIKTLESGGCRFALDDFGSGLSSFAYLKNLPVQFLKIDGAFVKAIVDDNINHAMVRSINEIGQVMGKQTIAEFVENEAILERLRGMGINYAQGYGIDRPRPIEQMK